MNARFAVRASVALLLLVTLSGTSRTPPPAPGPVVDSYYKLVPGKTDEWLELYRAQHLPILQEQQKKGEIVSIVIYRPVLHQGEPAWDYKVRLVWRDFAAFGDNAGQQAVERSFYPDWEKHQQAERRRWEITARHWDDLMVEVPAE